jgi:hypothetical protein
MKIHGYDPEYHLDLSGGTAVAAGTVAYRRTALGSNTPLADSGSGTPGSGPQAAPWDHVHPASGGASSFGSNSTRVASVSAAGASSSNSRADHVHDGIATVTASSSNSLNRGDVNLRAGDGIALALSNLGGGSGFDTVTIQNIASSSGGGGGGSVSYGSNSTRLSTVAAAGASSLVSRADHVHDGAASYPASIEGLFAWFKADAITGKSNGDTLTEWRNSAPVEAGRDLVAIGSPTYQTSVVNSLPVVRFGGSAYFLYNAYPMIANKPFTLFIVHKLSSIAPSYSGLWGFGISDAGGVFIKSTGKTAVYAPGSMYDGTGAITYGTTNWNYTTAVFGQTLTTRRNGSADITAGTLTLSGALQAVGYLGNQAVASRVFSGDMAEVLVFSRVLTSTEIAAVEGYIVGKYAI